MPAKNNPCPKKSTIYRGVMLGNWPEIGTNSYIITTVKLTTIELTLTSGCIGSSTTLGEQPASVLNASEHRTSRDLRPDAHGPAGTDVLHPAGGPQRKVTQFSIPLEEPAPSDCGPASGPLHKSRLRRRVYGSAKASEQFRDAVAEAAKRRPRSIGSSRSFLPLQKLLEQLLFLCIGRC